MLRRALVLATLLVTLTAGGASAGVIAPIDYYPDVLRAEVAAEWGAAGWHDAVTVAVDAYTAELEAAHQAELAAQAAMESAARAAAARNSARPAPASGFSSAAGPSGCANPIVSEDVARRESGCRWDAFNPTGCGGRGCVGFYQEDLGHFSPVSPWNPNVSGSCYGLNPSSPADQTECASRLGPGAWG